MAPPLFAPGVLQRKSLTFGCFVLCFRSSVFCIKQSFFSSRSFSLSDFDPFALFECRPVLTRCALFAVLESFRDQRTFLQLIITCCCSVRQERPREGTAARTWRRLAPTSWMLWPIR